MQDAEAVCNGEEWRPALGLEHRYEVSSHGRIRRRLSSSGAQRELKPYRDKKGYLRINLKCDRVVYRKFMHSLVMEAFVGPRPRGRVVNHIDARRDNNHLYNLEYVTHSQNTIHSVRLGRSFSIQRLVRIVKNKGVSDQKAVLAIALAATFSGIDLRDM